MTASAWHITVLVLFMSALNGATTAPQATLESQKEGTSNSSSNDIAKESNETVTSQDTLLGYSNTSKQETTCEDHNKSLSNSKNNAALESVSIHEEISEIKLIGKNSDSKNYNEPIATTGLDTNNSSYREFIRYFKNHYRMIYPGTLWCGDKDRAKSYDHLGYFYLTDSCCRQHDHCKDLIDPGQVRNGLKNSGLFPRFNCKCDLKLFNCLNKIRSLVSKIAGFVYFDVLAPQCFKKEYPIIQCRRIMLGKCVKYWVDSTQPKRWQWIDNPIFLFKNGSFY